MSGSTAVVVLLPDAEPLFEAVRQIEPRLVRPLPAHVSMLYPGPAPGPGVLREVTRLSPPSQVELGQVITAEDGFVGVAVPALAPAAARLRASFPTATPYDGRYGEAPPAHLTVALGATEVQVGQVTRLVRDFLPRTSKVLGPYLLERTGAGWRPVTG